MPIHYVQIEVADLSRSSDFYEAVLSPLGWRSQQESSGSVSWGLIKPALYLTQSSNGAPLGTATVSLPGKSIPAVRAAYEAALEKGAIPESELGVDPLMGRGNYAVRLRDPDGHLIEICVAHD